MTASRADVCVVACAEAWRGDGEVVASPMGTVPRLGALLARATFAPDLLITDGEACLVTEQGAVEGWLPFRSVFDVVAAGRRHVMMGASQLDQHGNQNISAIGDWAAPKVQLLGSRGAPGNTVNHTTSYWVPNHSRRVFVRDVDFVSGVGYQRAGDLGGRAPGHEIRVVVTNLAVLDFSGADHRMRLRSVHPGVDPGDVVAATGFELFVDDQVAETRAPSADELAIIDRLDPHGARHRDVTS